MLLYSVARSEDRLSSTAVLGPVFGGIYSVVLGTILGPIVGSIVERAGGYFRGMASSTLFGAIVLGTIGAAIGFSQIFGNDSDRPTAAAVLVVGGIIVSSILGGALAGAIAGLFTHLEPSPMIAAGS